jgi:uncharacterized protein (TIGR00304 family)
VAHRFDPTASLALVEPPSTRVVVPIVDYRLVLGSHHALLTPTILGQMVSVRAGDAPPKRFNDSLRILTVIDLTIVGVLLILAGFAVLFISAFRNASVDDKRVRGGAVIMIGPIPIVFGSDMKWASVAIVLAIILIVVAFVLYRV